MAEKADCVVIGAGVVGLAVARALALAGREVIVLEAAGAIGTETSSRNSEVIHAGVYYPPGSLKASLCVTGKQALYDYCAARGVTARAVGKIIVATSDRQKEKLIALKLRAECNGVGDLVWLDADGARSLEPNLSCKWALFSPSSGIIDSHAYMLALQGDLENAGGMVAFNAPVIGGAACKGRILIRVGGDESVNLDAAVVVNAAGLHASTVARMIAGMPAVLIPQTYFAKGNYFALGGAKSPFSRLVYPLPEDAGLGIHATIDLGGQTKFGPDVEWIDALDYSVNAERKAEFYASIRQYWPNLPDGSLTPTYSGIRPKIVAEGQPVADFLAQGPNVHGVDGLINLFGIESPGLTASLSLAQLIGAQISHNSGSNI